MSYGISTRRYVIERQPILEQAANNTFNRSSFEFHFLHSFVTTKMPLIKIYVYQFYHHHTSHLIQGERKLNYT